MRKHFLTALPVYNEVNNVSHVLDQVIQYSDNILVVDDGSRDGTADVLSGRRDIRVLRHDENRGYGSALRSAFDYAIDNHYEIVVTIDCDGQHEPQRIPDFIESAAEFDIVSGSRYLREFPGDTVPPAERRRINEIITAEINARTGLNLTDAFCGFKAYRSEVLASLRLTEEGYGMPLELWIQAAKMDCSIRELPVPLIYFEQQRSFGGALDEADTRLAYYRQILDRGLVDAGLRSHQH